LDEAHISHEVILVSDGSTDGTPEVARANGNDALRVIHYERNRGKGFALHTGLSHARGTYVAFIDSDGDLDPRELCRFLQLMQIYDAEMVIGSKRHALSDVSYPWQRRIMSWTYHKLVRVLFGVKASDTQTGIKLVRRDVLAAVLPRLVEKRFAFDLELLVAARRLGFRRLLEAPVTLNFHFTSTISPRAIKGIMLDTAAIWYRRYLLHWYDQPQGATDVVTTRSVAATVAD
jgi:glycosyltransferase involved in cell wall biosynthesis